jgi:hypothetical protein
MTIDGAGFSEPKTAFGQIMSASTQGPELSLECTADGYFSWEKASKPTLEADLFRCRQIGVSEDLTQRNGAVILQDRLSLNCASCCTSCCTS